MSDTAVRFRKMVLVIVVTWIISLVTTLAIVYFWQSISPPLAGEKIADNAITNLKLAAYAIPVFSTFESYSDYIEAPTTWTDITGASINLVLNRTSHLVILFSASARDTDPVASVELRALVGTTLAKPESISLGTDTDFRVYSCYFYLQNVNPGTYTVRIQWYIGSGTANIAHKTLTVLALPA